MGKYKPYDRYVNTDNDWIDKVPSHWSQVPLRSITTLSGKRNGDNTSHELLSVYREYGVIKKSSRDDNHNVASADLSNYKYVDKGYLVMNKMKMWQGSLGVSIYRGIVSPAYIVCRLDDSLNLFYINYLLRSANYKTIYNRLSYGVRVGQWDTRYDDLKNIKALIPPKEEQAQIVRYLDSKLAKINKFIRNKKRLIELLKEQKQAVTNQAVTKGLDPDAKMKPSGVEWLGDVPEGTEIKRIKRCIIGAINGVWGDEPKLDDTSNNIICIRVADFNTTSLTVGNKQLTIRNIKTDKANNRLLKQGDILLEKSGGGDKQPVGRVIMYTSKEPAVCSNFISRLKVDTAVVREDYLLYILHILQALRLNMPYIKQTTGIQNLDEKQYFNISIPIPPLNIQNEIVKHVKKLTFVIDQTIDRINKEIDLITEYRISLISAVVTGKVDVRGIEVDEPPAEELSELEPSDLVDEQLEEEEILQREVG